MKTKPDGWIGGTNVAKNESMSETSDLELEQTAAANQRRPYTRLEQTSEKRGRSAAGRKIARRAA